MAGKRPGWRERLRSLWDKIRLYKEIATVFTLLVGLLGIDLAFLRSFLWNAFVSVIGVVWAFLSQPAQPPLIVLVVLGIPLLLSLVGVIRHRLRNRLPNTQSRFQPTSNESVVIGGLVQFGGVTYQVAARGNSYDVDGPFCTKCSTPMGDRHGDEYSKLFRCEKKGCVGVIHLDDENRKLKDRAKRLVEGACRKALSEGKQPRVNIHKAFDS